MGARASAMVNHGGTATRRTHTRPPTRLSACGYVCFYEYNYQTHLYMVEERPILNDRMGARTRVRSACDSDMFIFVSDARRTRGWNDCQFALSALSHARTHARTQACAVRSLPLARARNERCLIALRTDALRCRCVVVFGLRCASAEFTRVRVCDCGE